MKPLIIPILITFLIVAAFFSFKSKINNDLSQPVYPQAVNLKPTSVLMQNTSTKTNTKSRSSLFVPYWTLASDQVVTADYDRVIYFGIEPGLQGISLSQQEVSRLESFMSISQGFDKLLTLRMTDTDENLEILESPVAQQKIITQTIDLAEEYKMSGIVLDLEVSAIPFDSITQRISRFSADFYKAVKAEDLSFSQTIYGDVFYRARPFDVKAIATNSDEVMIMAYDLHKAGGNPGPNFPLLGQEKYGYDFASMIDDFLQVVPPEKITVIFGVYGYDWTVSSKDMSLEQAEALSLNEITQKFTADCKLKECKISRDKDSGETMITYIDIDNKKHIVWFEDLVSIKQKQEFLRTKGINSFSLWGHSYF